MATIKRRRYGGGKCRQFLPQVGLFKVQSASGAVASVLAVWSPVKSGFWMMCVFCSWISMYEPSQWETALHWRRLSLAGRIEWSLVLLYKHFVHQNTSIDINLSEHVLVICFIVICCWSGKGWCLYLHQRAEGRLKYPTRCHIVSFVKYESHRIGCLNCRVALRFDKHLYSSAVKMPVKFRKQSDHSRHKLCCFETLWDRMIKTYSWLLKWSPRISRQSWCQPWMEQSLT